MRAEFADYNDWRFYAVCSTQLPPVPFVSESPQHSSALPSTIVCFASVSLYTITNATLRYLGELGAPTDWTIACKETFAVGLLLPWIFFRLLQGRYRWQSKRLVFVLIGSGVICQIIGAQSHLHAYTLVGLVIAVPVIQCSQLLGAALFGYVMLGDAVSRTKKISIALLILALVLLCAARVVPEIVDFNAAAHAQHLYLYGGLCALTAGIAYSLHTTLIRFATRRYWKSGYGTWQSLRLYSWIGHNFSIDDTPEELATNPRTGKVRFYSPFPVTLVMLIITGVGMLYFGGHVLWTRGPAGLVDVPPIWWFWIFLAATTNLVGFFFQVQGLLMASASKMTLISASQIVILTLIGVLFFGEPMSLIIILGGICAVIGVGLTSTEKK